MSRSMLAEFGSPDAITAAADGVGRDGFAILDALTPFPMPELSDQLGAGAWPIRIAMALAGFATAAFAFGLQYYSSVYAYPINSGGRPLDSWPVFLLVPFEVGVLGAALAGFATFLVRSGLPRLHHPVFDLPNIERASQDRFFLLVDVPASEAGARRLGRALAEAGALSVSEVGP